MQLTVTDAARLLRTSEKQIFRWIDSGEIPFYRVADQLRFNRDDLLEWANSHRIAVAAHAFLDGDRDAPRLADALLAGGVHADVPGADREAVLRAAVARMPLGPDFDREMLLHILLAREAAGSTGVGDGVAIPHVRHPVVASGARPSITLCYLAHPVEYGASDGKPVHTLFTIATPTIASHLQLLARLAAALHDAGFRAAIARRAPVDEVLREARRLDEAPPPTATAGDGE